MIDKLSNKTPIDLAKDMIGKDAYLELLKMPPSVLHSLLLQVFHDRIEHKTVADVFREYKSNRFVLPSEINQDQFNKLDQTFFNVMDDTISVIELSPVAVLGVNAVLAGIDQNNVISAIRGIEVMADTVTTLAMECARLRSVNNNDNPIFLCTSQREVRAQLYEPETKFTPHFKGISLVTSHKFEHNDILIQMLVKHIRFYLRGVTQFVTQNDEYSVNKIIVAISSTRLSRLLISAANIDMEQIRRNTRRYQEDIMAGIKIPRLLGRHEQLDKHIAQELRITSIVKYIRGITIALHDELQSDFPNVEFVMDLKRFAGINYYTDACFNIMAENSSGDMYQLVDGGETDWTKRILQDKRERCIAGGMGTEMFLKLFKNKT